MLWSKPRGRGHPAARAETTAKAEKDMELERFLDALYDCPVVASVKEEAGLEQALASECRVVFLLFGDVVTLPAVVKRVRESGKYALVHPDLVEGLAPREIAVDYLARKTEADGIITTRPQLARRAKSLGLLSLQRFFLLDSMAVENMRRQLEQDTCDLIEVLPGCMPRVIRDVACSLAKPVIAGGLIRDKEDVTGALAAGAVAVSATSPEVWCF